MLKKTVSLFVAISIISSLCIPALADEETSESKLYPIVFVHGMMGWGENAYGDHEYRYWGMAADNDIAQSLRDQGYEVYAPSVGPISSAWDRACELFAQLTGTVVDYGAAHSAAEGHERYGRDYTGQGLLSSDWYESGKINLISHSFGGPAVRVFSSLLAYGYEEEQKAAPNDCSPLFKGGFGESVFSVTTLESPHNGSTVANVVNDLFFPLMIFGLMANKEGMKDEIETDYMLDQWGLTADPAKGEKAKFNPLGIIKLVKSGDHCAYDMSLQGAREICETFKTSEDTYYFSVAANMMEKNSVGLILPTVKHPLLRVASFAMAALARMSFHGIKTDESWAYSDGMVPVPSGLYPYGQEHEDYDGKTTEGLKKGVWYVFPVVEGANHGYGTEGDCSAFYEAYIERITALQAI